MTPEVQAAAISEPAGARFKRLLRIILRQTWKNFRRRLPRALIMSLAFMAALTVFNFVLIGIVNNGLDKHRPFDNAFGFFRPPTNSSLRVLRNPLVGGFFGGIFLSIFMTVGMNLWRVTRKKGLAAALRDVSDIPGRIRRYFRESDKAAWSNLLSGAGMALVMAVLLGKYASLALALGMGSLLMSSARQGLSTLVSSAWEATYGTAKGVAAKEYGVEAGYVIMAGSSPGFILRAYIGGLYPANRFASPDLIAGLVLLALALIAAKAGGKAAAAAAAVIGLPFLAEFLSRAGLLFADDRGFKEFGGTLAQYLKSEDARLVLKAAFKQGAGTGIWVSLLNTTWSSFMDSVPREEDRAEAGPAKPVEPSLLDENGQPLERNSEGKYKWETPSGTRWVSQEEAQNLINDEIKSRAQKEADHRKAVEEGRRQSDDWMNRKGEEGLRSQAEMEAKKAAEEAAARAEQRTRDHMVERLRKLAAERGGDFAEEFNKLLADGNYEGMRDFYRDKLGHQIAEGQEEAARALAEARIYQAGEAGSKFLVAASKSALVALGTGGMGIIATAVATGAISAAGDGMDSYLQGDSGVRLAGKTLVGFLSGAKDGAIGVYTGMTSVGKAAKLLLPAGADAAETYVRLNIAALDKKKPEDQLTMLLRATGDGVLSLGGNFLNSKIKNIKGAFTREAADAAADMVKGGLSSLTKGGTFEDGFQDAFISHLGGRVGSHLTDTYVDIPPGADWKTEIKFGKKSEDSGPGRSGPGDAEPRRIGADDERKRIGMDEEPRRIGADDEPKRIGSDDEPKRIGADEEAKRIGADEEPLRITGKNQREVDLDQEHLRNIADGEKRLETWRNSDPDTPAERAKATVDALENYQAKRMMKDESLPADVRRQWAADVAEYRDKPLFKELADQCNGRKIMVVDWQSGSMRPVTPEDFGRVSSGRGPGMDIDVMNRGDLIDAETLKPVKLETLQEATSDACKKLNFDQDKQGIHYGGGEKGSQDPESFPVKPGSTARRMFHDDQLRKWDGADGEQARQVADYKGAKAPQTLGEADGLSERCRESVKNFDRITQKQMDIHAGARLPEKFSPEAIEIIRGVGSGELPPGTGNQRFRELTGVNLEDGVRRLNTLQESVIKLDPDKEWRAGRVPEPPPPKPRGPQPDLSNLVKGDKAFMDRVEQQKRLEEQLARGETPENVPAGKIKTREEYNASDREKGIRPGDRPDLPGHEEKMEELRKQPVFEETEKRVKEAERAAANGTNERAHRGKEGIPASRPRIQARRSRPSSRGRVSGHPGQAGIREIPDKIESKLDQQEGASAQDLQRFGGMLEALNPEPQASGPGRISGAEPPGQGEPLAAGRYGSGGTGAMGGEVGQEPPPDAAAAPTGAPQAAPRTVAPAPQRTPTPPRPAPAPEPPPVRPAAVPTTASGPVSEPPGVGDRSPKRVYPHPVKRTFGRCPPPNRRVR